MARPILGWAGLAAAAALIAALVPLPTTSATTPSRGVPEAGTGGTQIDRIEVPAAITAGRADGVVAELDRTGTDPYRMLAVTWTPAADPVRIEVRTRVDGRWSAWQRLEADDDGPAAGRTAGTVPLWVGRADGVAARVRARDGAAPEDLRVVTIDPPGAPASGRQAVLPNAGQPMGRPPGFPARPPIVTREQWHADPDLGDTCDKPVYGSTTKAAIVHHTAGTNDYSPSESVGIVQGILAYHTESRGWCDIGYNFLVDRFGRVFEGRDGGMSKPVRGAHSGDFNVNTVGVSMMGDFDRARPPRRLKNALVRVIGWRLGTTYAHPGGRTTVHGKRIDRISGHRDVMPTACPGGRGYDWLPLLRGRIDNYLSRFESQIRLKGRALGRSTTGPVFVGERRVSDGRRTRFVHGNVYWKRSTGAHYLPRGAILRGYVERGGTGGRLGFLERDYRETERGATGRFEHGELRYDERTEKVTARYW